MPRQRKGPRRRTTKSAGVVALKKVNKIIRNTEKKFLDNDDTIMPGSGFQIVPLNLIGQGDTASSREGAKIVITSLNLKYTVKQNTASSQTRCRIMIVKDKQVNEATFVPNDLLQSTALGTAIVSMKNLDNIMRFQILYNKVHTLQSTGTSVNQGQFFKRMNLPCRYSGSGGAIGNVASIGLFLVAVSDEATNQPNVSFWNRIKFLDS